VEPRALRQLRTTHDRQDEELRRLITEAVRAGIRSQDIAEALGVSRSTLWRRYADQLRRPDRRVTGDAGPATVFNRGCLEGDL
jgi:CRP-like cAMP-binding protein